MFKKLHMAIKMWRMSIKRPVPSEKDNCNPIPLCYGQTSLQKMVTMRKGNVSLRKRIGLSPEDGLAPTMFRPAFPEQEKQVQQSATILPPRPSIQGQQRGILRDSQRRTGDIEITARIAGRVVYSGRPLRNSEDFACHFGCLSGNGSKKGTGNASQTMMINREKQGLRPLLLLLVIFRRNG
jgi:hypothetical protein